MLCLSCVGPTRGGVLRARRCIHLSIRQSEAVGSGWVKKYQPLLCDRLHDPSTGQPSGSRNRSAAAVGVIKKQRRRRPGVGLRQTGAR